MQIFYGIVFLVLTVAMAKFRFSDNKLINTAAIFFAALLGCLWVMVPGILPLLCVLTITYLLVIGGVSDNDSILTSLVLSIPAGIKFALFLSATLSH